MVKFDYLHGHHPHLTLVMIGADPQLISLNKIALVHFTLCEEGERFDVRVEEGIDEKILTYDHSFCWRETSKNSEEMRCLYRKEKCTLLQCNAEVLFIDAL